MDRGKLQNDYSKKYKTNTKVCNVTQNRKNRGKKIQKETFQEQYIHSERERYRQKKKTVKKETNRYKQQQQQQQQQQQRYMRSHFTHP